MDITEKLGLPPVKKIKLRSEVDFYGASHVIAENLGLKKVPMSFATWRHGWTFYPLMYISQLIWTDEGFPVHLVPTEREANFLEHNNVKNSIAVGTPFVYVNSGTSERIARSLLVMPPQNFYNSSDGIAESSYVDYILGISSHFSKVVFCLHQASIEEGNWFPSLEKAGFDWIVGAAPDDANSLFRLKKIFLSFEFVTSCVLGSHLVYGAYCGCKVSISGGYQSVERSFLARHEYYRKFPELLELSVNFYSEAFVRNNFNFLFVDPWMANENIEWAKNETGSKYRKSSVEIKNLLGWNFADQAYLRLSILKKFITKKTKITKIFIKCF